MFDRFFKYIRDLLMGTTLPFEVSVFIWVKKFSNQVFFPSNTIYKLAKHVNCIC